MLLIVITMYLTQFGAWVVKDSGDPFTYSSDYLGYWTAGKIADEKGYSEIYDVNNLRGVIAQELSTFGSFVTTDSPALLLVPGVPYLPVFALPFQILSRVDLKTSFWIWAISNFVLLIGYLLFFLRKLLPGRSLSVYGLNFLFLALFSFPVFSNFMNGQVNVFMLVCLGEYLRYALNKKPVLSGLWLGGLLLKPQLLIIVVPIILLMRYWKVLFGFIASSVAILLTSLLLSGFSGMKALIFSWIGFGSSNSVLNPEAMVNWRMIGVYLNAFLNTQFGWVITGLGIILTILVVYRLVKRNPAYGSPEWVLTMLGVFSATIAILWHAHYHTALILIPLLIYVSVNKLLSEKIIYLWVGLTPLASLGLAIVSPLVLLLAKINIIEYQGMVIAFSGFVVNLVVLISTLKYSKGRSVQQESLPV